MARSAAKWAERLVFSPYPFFLYEAGREKGV
jgi:hypothetical protein